MIKIESSRESLDFNKKVPNQLSDLRIGIIIRVLVFALFITVTLSSGNFLWGEQSAIPELYRFLHSDNLAIQKTVQIVTFFYKNFSVYLVIYICMRHSSEKYQNLIKVFIFYAINHILNFAFRVKRPYWEDKQLIGGLCQNTYASFDNSMMTVLVFFIVDNSFTRNRLALASAIAALILQYAYLFINGNYYIVNILLNLFLLYIYIDYKVFLDYLLDGNQLFIKPKRRTCVALFYTSLGILFSLYIFKESELDSIKRYEFENHVS
jgi:hypothetical protein